MFKVELNFQNNSVNISGENLNQVWIYVVNYLRFLVKFCHWTKICELSEGNKSEKNRNYISQQQCSIWSSYLVHFCKMIISAKPYIMRLSFMVHICKMICPAAFFYFFKVLIFLVGSRLKGQKMFQNDKIFCLSHLISQE